MPSMRQRWRYTGLLAALLGLAGCGHETAVQRLSPPEQAEWHTYRHALTAAQVRAYLAHTTPAARTAYLRELGLVPRFEAFDPLDRDAILAGYPRRGMSAAALRFLWGEPYYTDGRSNVYEHWHYLGSSLALAASGNTYGTFGNRVVVYLEHGQITAWLDYVPTTDDAGSTDDWGQ